MGYISNIKDIVTVVSIVATIALTSINIKKSQEIDRINNNLSATTVQYTDAKGRLVTKTTELRFTKRELENAIIKSQVDSMNMTFLEKRLAKVGEEADALGIKNKHLEEAFIGDLSVSNDSLVSEIVYSEDRSLKELKPIKTKHLELNFTVDGDRMLVDHKYNTDLAILGHKEVDKKTKKGKRRFFVARWFNPRWKYNASAVADDKDAVFNITNIKFQKKKGGRS